MYNKYLNPYLRDPMAVRRKKMNNGYLNFSFLNELKEEFYANFNNWF